MSSDSRQDEEARTRKLHIFISNLRLLNSLKQVTGNKNARMDITKLDEYLQNHNWSRTSSRFRDTNVVVTRVVTGLLDSRKLRHVRRLYNQLNYKRVHHAPNAASDIEALIDEAYEVAWEGQPPQGGKSTLIFVVGACSNSRYGYRGDEDPFLSNDMYSRFVTMADLGYDIEVVGWGQDWWDQSSISNIYSDTPLFEDLGMRYHSLSRKISHICFQENVRRGLRGRRALSQFEDLNEESEDYEMDYHREYDVEYYDDIYLGIFEDMGENNVESQAQQEDDDDSDWGVSETTTTIESYRRMVLQSETQPTSERQQDSNVAGGAVIESTTSSSPPLHDTMTCIICFDNPRNMILIPCGHIIMCSDCHRRLRASTSNNHMKCPKCRKDVASTSRAYF